MKTSFFSRFPVTKLPFWPSFHLLYLCYTYMPPLLSEYWSNTVKKDREKGGKNWLWGKIWKIQWEKEGRNWKINRIKEKHRFFRDLDWKSNGKTQKSAENLQIFTLFGEENREICQKYEEFVWFFDKTLKI